jgi:hypothetical protein
MTKHKPKKLSSRRSALKALAILGIGAPLTAIVTNWVRTPAAANRTQRLGLPFYASEEEARPLPETMDPKLFSMRYIKHAYRVAKEIPGVLAQQPCYCECRSYGHQSLLNCYTSNHAAGCDICVREALFAERLTKEGKSPSDIREAILKGAWRSEVLA